MISWFSPKPGGLMIASMMCHTFLSFQCCSYKVRNSVSISTIQHQVDLNSAVMYRGK